MNCWDHWIHVVKWSLVNYFKRIIAYCGEENSENFQDLLFIELELSLIPEDPRCHDGSVECLDLRIPGDSLSFSFFL